MNLLLSGQTLDQILIKMITELIKNNWLLIILLFVVWLLIWLLIREVKTWYWKINDIIALLKKIENNTNLALKADDSSNNQPRVAEETNSVN